VTSFFSRDKAKAPTDITTEKVTVNLFYGAAAALQISVVLNPDFKSAPNNLASKRGTETGAKRIPNAGTLEYPLLDDQVYFGSDRFERLARQRIICKVQ
jgi:hypothetical protein